MSAVKLDNTPPPRRPGVADHVPALRGSADTRRLRQRLEVLATVGATPEGGVTRLALTREEESALEICGQWMEGLGMELRRDGIGNLFGRLPGNDGTTPAFVVGSHLDSVPNGGRFDGVAGVLCALEALEILAEKRVQLHSTVEIVAFVGEESSRFSLSTLGSRAATGHLEAGTLQQTKDQSGTSVAEALRALGRDPVTAMEMELQPEKLRGFIEVHVEQRENLELLRKPLGLVTGCVGTTRMKVTLTGEARHSGTTPMGSRKDALCAAAELILTIEKAAKREASLQTVATVGTVGVEPNAINVIPGRTSLGVDIRGVDSESLGRVHAAVERRLRDLETQGFQVDCELISRTEPLDFDGSLVRVLEEAAEDLEYPTTRTFSAAGHDAMNMAMVTPTAMVFLPSRGGISHHPEEHSEMTHLAMASELLAFTLVKLDLEGRQ